VASWFPVVRLAATGSIPTVNTCDTLLKMFCRGFWIALLVTSNQRFDCRALFIVMLTVFVVVMISVVYVVRVVIVINTAAIPVPVTCIVPFAVVMRSNPASSLVGRSSPIAFMPFVMVSHRIPITLYPQELRSWPFWHNHNDPGWRWRGNHDSNGNLRIDYRARG
jgi:hypothetical protein